MVILTPSAVLDFNSLKNYNTDFINYAHEIIVI